MKVFYQFCIMNKFLLSLFLTGCVSVATAVTPYEEILADPQKAGGVYFAYPERESKITNPPAGYKPFYASHYGRHGSRYLISDADYTRIAETLHKGFQDNALTPLGVRVMNDLDSLMIETAKRGGDLTPLGVRQHRGIAERMFTNYPQIFKGAPEVSARSTTVPRCILSMDAFCERLKELNPKIRATRESSGTYMDYLNYHSDESNTFTSGDWKIEYEKFVEERIHPQRLMKALFNNESYVRKNIKEKNLYWGLYWIAVDGQNVETKVDFMHLFPTEELYSIWECGNYNNYVCDADFALSNGLVVGNANNLLNNIIESADAAISSGENSATLRFGHDGNLMPLAARLHLKGCDASTADPDSISTLYANFRVSPMAGNIQMIFFRDEKDKTGKKPILVKFLLNEEETTIPIPPVSAPFYNWEDVKSFYQQK